MKYTIVCCLFVFVTGCNSLATIHETRPEVIECKGKVSLAGTGTISAGVSGSNSWSLLGDCGDDFKLTIKERKNP